MRKIRIWPFDIIDARADFHASRDLYNSKVKKHILHLINEKTANQDEVEDITYPCSYLSIHRSSPSHWYHLLPSSLFLVWSQTIANAYLHWNAGIELPKTSQASASFKASLPSFNIVLILHLPNPINLPVTSSNTTSPAPRMNQVRLLIGARAFDMDIVWTRHGQLHDAMFVDFTTRWFPRRNGLLRQHCDGRSFTGKISALVPDDSAEEFQLDIRVAGFYFLYHIYSRFLSFS